MSNWIVAPAAAADLPEIARLVNSAYRGDESRKGWTSEADLLGGQRTDPASLAEELAGPDPSAILCLRQEANGPIWPACSCRRTPPSMGVRRAAFLAC